MDARRVALGAVIIGYLISSGLSKSLDVVWISPAEGTVFSPGNTITAKWTSSSALVSPGFKLCVVSGDRKQASSGDLESRGEKEKGEESEKCGIAIWPPVQQAEDGYMVAITAPEAALTSKYTLEMQDDFGNIFISPVFELGGVSSKEVAKNSTAASASASSSESETPTPVNATGNSHDGPNSMPLTKANATAVPPRFGVPQSSLQPPSSPQPDVLVSRRPVSTAAIAVPLSVVAGIILVAGVMGYRTRRTLAKDRKRELKSLILSQNNTTTDGYGSVADVHRAISVLSSRKDYSGFSTTQEAPLPFVAKPEPRSVTREPYNPMSSSIPSGSIHDNYASALHYASPPSQDSDTGRGKSLTAHYTAAGTLPPSESTSFQPLSFSTSNSSIPHSLLPAQMPPLHIRSESPGDRPLPAPPAPISCLSPSGSTNVYDALAARLKGYQ
ncbi:hypothetical protein NP233_g3167 [Leucocoprinus birnbaumii]|uniref:Uncharacterized protein n=1 Tax=Leucocoprinus birnbaumii TaxID=56174 RepID=A0AAD5VX14_9AGAR|nr:hypothetical protein NP233_g3167 [Leucocoprinus birnbaumii]